MVRIIEISLSNLREIRFLVNINVWFVDLKFKKKIKVTENGFNYDAWFDYLRLLENEQCPREEVEDTYERAIANIPPHLVRVYCSSVFFNQKCRLRKFPREWL